MPADSLDLLRELAAILDDARDLPVVLDSFLKTLAKGRALSRCVVTLIDPDDGQIRIEAAYGLNAIERERGAYAPGEGVTGAVVAHGESIGVADVSREPLFLNRACRRDLTRESASFVCVPIKSRGEAVGALSIEFPEDASRKLDEETRFVAIAASLLARIVGESAARKERGSDKTAFARAAGMLSPAIRQVYDQIRIVAPSATTVLLLGESGTGKELAPRAIHESSPRASKPFVSLDCAALPVNLIESELFGHERGAFTGADSPRKGRFELADGGTLFLDEIGELPLLAQAKLLRALRDKSFEPLGSARTRRVDIRLIAATNRNLAAMVEAGTFRGDLYYRLNVFPIRLPPLRERKEDILPLAIFFLKRCAARDGKAPPRLSPDAMEILQNYAWPGNARELENCMERAWLLLGSGNALFPDYLPAESRENRTRKDARARETLREKLDRLEKDCLLDALRDNGGNMKKAAAALGLTERIMGLRAKKYALNCKAFRGDAS
ncbi:MAG: sigma 54-interacting transcriptional regulator [Desulfovibrio sp.]|nr:sigma 54-interacting transcriptional regulator [Desulfovibrio sp.]